MAEHRFHFKATWPGGRNSVGAIECGALQSRISIATGMGGPGIGTNPDEMLLGAAGTCYLITLAAMLERAGIAVASMALASEIVIDVTNGVFACKKIIHRPQVRLADGADDAQRRKLAELLVTAERRCMISNALRGNVEITVAPQTR
jgi:peroxiredoxin-like protein